MNKLQVLHSWAKERRFILTIPLIFSAVTFVMFWIYSYDFSEFLHIVITSGGFSLVFITVDCVRYYINLKKIENIGLSPPLTLPETNDCHQLEYQKILLKMEKQIAALNTDYSEVIQKSRDYYTLWTHQIKTPIMAAKLLLGQDNIDMATLKIELFKIEQYVDMALGYQRLYSIESDFIFEEYTIDSLVKEAVKNFSTVFIYQQTKLNIDCLDGALITDKKWFVFVLEQILSNALKYSPDGEIKIYTKNEHLVIEDTGIGIKSEYLPRIFERGFSGNIGRTNQHSTGIGLYLCRETLAKLSLTIRVESQHKVGTKVFVSLKPLAP